MCVLDVLLGKKYKALPVSGQTFVKKEEHFSNVRVASGRPTLGYVRAN